MRVEQIANIVNTISEEILGQTELVNEDLSNLVDVGNPFANLMGNAYENYVRKLIDHIGRVVFVNRPYSGTAPSVLMDAWEYGSILEKITAAMPDAQEDESWRLVDGEIYEQDEFYQPDVSAKFYDSLTTFEIPMSFAQMQSKSAFDNATQLNAFFSMIETSIYNSLTVKTDAIISRTINSAIAHTIDSAFPSGGYDSGSDVKAVNLLYLYNQAHPTTPITDFNVAISTPEFIRFASYIMGMYVTRLGKISTLFNAGAQPRFTPTDRLHFVMLDAFAASANVYNQSDTFHDNFTALPSAELVPYWQGSGTDYGLNDISTINVQISGEGGTKKTVNVSGVLGVMFDRDALGVCNKNQRVTSHYNARAEFINNWYKVDSMQFYDGNENTVVFYADVASNEDSMQFYDGNENTVVASNED